MVGFEKVKFKVKGCILRSLRSLFSAKSRYFWHFFTLKVSHVRQNRCLFGLVRCRSFLAIFPFKVDTYSDAIQLVMQLNTLCRFVCKNNLYALNFEVTTYPRNPFFEAGQKQVSDIQIGFLSSIVMFFVQDFKVKLKIVV
jgi:hypothetical protein